MALHARHKWMAENVSLIVDPRGTDDAIRKVEEAFRESQNAKKISDFLEGKSRRQHLFFYFQKPDIVTQNNEYQDAPGDPRIIVTYGEQERLKARGAYFLRVTQPADKPLRLDVASDIDLLFGEISQQPLDSLNVGIKELFLPMLQQTIEANDALRTKLVFGQCDSEQRQDFGVSLQKFASELQV